MNIVPIRDSTEYEYVVLNEEITSRDKRSASRVGSCGKQGEKRSQVGAVKYEARTTNKDHEHAPLHCGFTLFVTVPFILSNCLVRVAGL